MKHRTKILSAILAALLLTSTAAVGASASADGYSSVTGSATITSIDNGKTITLKLYKQTDDRRRRIPALPSPVHLFPAVVKVAPKVAPAAASTHPVCTAFRCGSRTARMQ